MRLMSSGKEPQRLLSMKLRGVKIELLLKYILITEYLAIGPFILYVLFLASLRVGLAKPQTPHALNAYNQLTDFTRKYETD